MKLNENDPRFPLPDEEEWRSPRYGHRFLERMRDLLRLNATVTRELQTPPAFHVARVAPNLDIPGTGTNVVLPFNSTEIDTHGWWNVGTLRYTPRESGYYLFSVNVGWYLTYTSATGYSVMPQVSLRRNGTVMKAATTGKDFSVSAGQTYSSGFSCVMLSDANANKSGGADYWDIVVKVGRADAADETLLGYDFLTYWSGHFIGARRAKYE